METTGKIHRISDLLPQTDIAAYDHIELTPEEELRALRFAKATKARYIEGQQELDMRKAAVKKALEPWTGKELREHVMNKAAKLPFCFRVDQDNGPVFDLLTMYFSEDTEFEKYGAKDQQGKIIQQYSLNKGICLHSKERGTGKTVLMELFTQNKKNCFAVVSTAKITSFFEADGDIILKRFSAPWQAEKVSMYFYQSPVGICFDDLGDEEIKRHYGNKENVMGRILTNLYSDFPDKSAFKFFHLTTNLTGQEIEESYDKRVRSRMREMFNWIELPGKDRRR